MIDILILFVVPILCLFIMKLEHERFYWLQYTVIVLLFLDTIRRLLC